MRILLLGVAILSMTVTVNASAADNRVVYNNKLDTITIHARDASLLKLLGVIAIQTGLDIRMDPEAESPVSCNIIDKPLGLALKQLLRDRNQVTFFSKINNRSVLTALHILPKGKQQSDQLKPVIGLQQQAFGQAQHGKYLSAARWNERLSRLQPHIRTRLEKLVEKNNAFHEKQEREKKQRHERLRSELAKKRSAAMSRFQEADKRRAMQKQETITGSDSVDSLWGKQ